MGFIYYHYDNLEASSLFFPSAALSDVYVVPVS